MDPVDPSSTSDASVLPTGSPAINFARVLLWAKQHGPVVALAMFVLVEGGYLLPTLAGAIC